MRHTKKAPPSDPYIIIVPQWLHHSNIPSYLPLLQSIAIPFLIRHYPKPSTPFTFYRHSTSISYFQPSTSIYPFLRVSSFKFNFHHSSIPSHPHLSQSIVIPLRFPPLSHLQLSTPFCLLPFDFHFYHSAIQPFQYLSARRPSSPSNNNCYRPTQDWQHSTSPAIIQSSFIV